VIGIDRYDTIEWLTSTGWELELAGTSLQISGSARKNVGGRLLEVSADASTLDDLTWKLLALAAEALEDLESRQAAAVAAA